MKTYNTHMNIMSLSMRARMCAYTHTPVKIVSSSSFLEAPVAIMCCSRMNCWVFPPVCVPADTEVASKLAVPALAFWRAGSSERQTTLLCQCQYTWGFGEE